MSSGKKQDDFGLEKILLTIKDNGTVVSEEDISRLRRSPWITMYLEVDSPASDTSFRISIQCVPSITDSKDQKLLPSSASGSESSDILEQFYDAIIDEEDPFKQEYP